MKKRILLITFTSFILDQLLKYIVISSIPYHDTIHLIPNFMYLTYVKNTGGAWSIFPNQPWLFIIIGLVCLSGFGYFIYKKNQISKLESLYFGFMIGGIVGNFFDRIVRHGVVDYIGFIFGKYYFPVFNLADILIVVGAILLIIDSFRGDNDGNRSNEG